MGIEVGAFLAANATAITAASAAVGAGAAIHGNLEARQQGKAQSKAQERSEAARLKGESIKASRERRKQVQQSLIAQANITASAGAQGAGGSSAVAGGQSNVAQQAASNISFLNTQQSLAGTQSIFNTQANKAATRQATAQGVGNLGAELFTASGGFGALKKGAKATGLFD